MKIGELASHASCDVQTIRFYEREGLLDAPRRDASGYRRYDAHHLARVRFIRHCRALDMPLPEVRQLLDFAAHPARSCQAADELLARHLALVRERLRSLRALERQLVDLRGACDGDGTHPCRILEHFEAEAGRPGA